MGLDPRKMRELVVVLLFTAESTDGEISPGLIAMVSKQCKVSKRYVLEATQQVQQVLERQAECDEIITSFCRDYTIERLGCLERVVARYGIYELLENKLPSVKIVIAEAKRLVRKFSSIHAATFIHALLAFACERLGYSVESEVDCEKAVEGYIEGGESSL